MSSLLRGPSHISRSARTSTVGWTLTLTCQFEEEDVVHQYDPNRPHFAISTHQPHPPPHRRTHTDPPILESMDEEADSPNDLNRPRALTSPAQPQAQYLAAAETSPWDYPDPYQTLTPASSQHQHRPLPDTDADEPRRPRGLASLFHLGGGSNGPSPKGSRSDLHEYPKAKKHDDEGEERDRLFDGRPSEDLYRSPPGRGGDGESSPENSPVRYTQRL